MRFFNTEGPVRSEDHYCLPPLGRWDLDDVLGLIERKKYFLLHAPRQTGKTTCLLALMEYLNREGRCRAVYANLEVAQTARGDVGRGVAAICSVLGRSAALYLKDGRPQAWCREVGETVPADDRLTQLLAYWAAADAKPLVVLLDEVDALVGDTLIALLRQLRAGYTQRPLDFPSTVVLCGVRDLRDYRIHSSTERRPSPAAAPSTSRPSPCAWRTSPLPRWPSCLLSTPMRLARPLPPRPWAGLGADPGPALAGQCPGLRELLSNAGRARALAPHRRGADRRG